MNILGAIAIFSCLFSIIAIFLSDAIIKKFELEKYPLLYKFIEVRRKFQTYYFW
jgi:hypothetical protein